MKYCRSTIALAGAAIIGLGLSVLAGSAMAEVPLTDDQMDNVTAGLYHRTELYGFAFASATANSTDGTPVSATTSSSVVVANGSVDTDASSGASGQNAGGFASVQANELKFDRHGNLISSRFSLAFGDYNTQGGYAGVAVWAGL